MIIKKNNQAGTRHNYIEAEIVKLKSHFNG